MKKIIGIVLGICYSTLVWAQSVEQIKADRSTYLWGEGKGNTLKKADSEALSDLINQITTTIESDFTLLQEEKSESVSYTHLDVYKRQTQFQQLFTDQHLLDH